MKKLIIIFLFLTSVLQAQVNYYVSNTGGGDTLATIAEVNALTLEAGDSVLFKRGDIWRGTGIEVDQSGTYGNYITFGAYGTGEKPRLLGSLKAVTWTETAVDNVWESATAIATDPWLVVTASGTNCNIFFELTTDSVAWGYHETYTANWTNLNSEYEWTWNSNTLYVYSTTDPDSRYSSIEAPQIQYGAIINHKDYIAFDNIELAYFGGYGVRDAYPPANQAGFRFTNMYVHHIGRKGSNIAYGFYIYRSKIYAANNEIHDCGRRAMSIEPVRYDGVRVILDSVLIENNYFHDGWHTFIDINTSGKHVVKNVTIRNNILLGNPYVDITARDNTTSNHMFLANQCPVDTSVLDKSYNFYVYNNILTYMAGKGINFEKVDSAYVYNNTFYGWNPSLTTYQAFIYLSDNGNGHPEYLFAKNNIFYDNSDYDINSDLSAIKVDADWWDELTLDYNLYYTEDARTGFYEMRGVDIGYWVEGDNYTMGEWDEYLSERGMDANSPDPDDPLFISPITNDFSLEPTSTAIDAGTPISYVTTDYYDTPRSESTPTIGAVEYGLPDASAHNILTFTFPTQLSSATIDTTNHTVSVDVTNNSDITNLTPTITLSYGATINPTSGTARNFTNPVNYTVTASDESTQVWVITVTQETPSQLGTAFTDTIYVAKSILATVYGNILSDGGGVISARGICYGTSINPSLSGTYIQSSGTTGSYEVSLSNLKSNTLYYIRSYVTNEGGTSYGANVSFTTTKYSNATSGGKVLYSNGKIVIIN